MFLSPFSVCASRNDDASGDQDSWHLTMDHEYQCTDCAASPCSPAKSVKNQCVKDHSLMFYGAQSSSEGQRLEGLADYRLLDLTMLDQVEALERLKVELEDQSTEGCTPDQSTQGCAESPPDSPTPSLEVMLSSVVPTVRPLVSPKSSTSSPFLATLSPGSMKDAVMMELMLDMIYRAKNAKKKGMVTRTLSLDDEELESLGSLSGSEKTFNVSRTAKLTATVKEMLHRTLLGRRLK